ncbi:type III polyketide synthase [Kineosporia sp. J2-2]|uniref:Type III polyketide synthase n=1 Tax=Kineosporia corallincola TaxID=2835133 RepID=A0ABS5TD13_9ACTN|nr:type III polyketide synthase [Kineosporia corallincola]MBT0767968.1 type III polyketide synthase [Kineosporia corallincola]
MSGLRGHRAVITGQGHAVPEPVPQEDIWREVFAPRLNHDRIAGHIFRSAGITTRHAGVDPRHTDVSGWSTGDRMRRYVTEARGLGGEAVTAALAQAGLSSSEIGFFVVVSCTGYATPGLDIMIADQLGMPLDVRRLLVGHMGCYAAIPGLQAAADFVRAQGLPAVLLCVELPSLHLQRSDDPADLQTVVSHALFADAAAALVIEPDAGAGLELLRTTAATVPGTEALMTWDVTAHGFRMGLSPKVPDVLAGQVAEATAELLTPFGHRAGDVAGWAVHPGGRRIVDVVQERLHLPAELAAPSREVLDRYGNCSSPTVLLVLESIRRGRRLESGDPVVLMAFGPGLTLCSALLRTVC